MNIDIMDISNYQTAQKQQRQTKKFIKTTKNRIHSVLSLISMIIYYTCPGLLDLVLLIDTFDAIIYFKEGKFTMVALKCRKINIHCNSNN